MKLVAKDDAPKLIEMAKGPHSNSAFKEACREILNSKVPGNPRGITFAQGIALVLAKAALGGNIPAAKELVDRAEGKVTTSVEVRETKVKD